MADRHRTSSLQTRSVAKLTRFVCVRCRVVFFRSSTRTCASPSSCSSKCSSARDSSSTFVSAMPTRTLTTEGHGPAPCISEEMTCRWTALVYRYDAKSIRSSSRTLGFRYRKSLYLLGKECKNTCEHTCARSRLLYATNAMQMQRIRIRTNLERH